MVDNNVEPQSIHPDEYRRDLNPNAMAGGRETEKGTRTAYEVKDVNRSLRGFTDDELKQIPVLATGTRLRQGATYLDLANLARREITATGDMEAGPHNHYTPKTEVDYQLWNRLLNVQDPERTGQGNTP